MFRYKLKLNGKETHVIESPNDIDNPWDLSKMSGWGYDGSNHEVEKEDITAEKSRINQEKLDRNNARKALRSMDLDNGDLRDMLKTLVKALT